jgi:predicted nucleotidyltransferase
MELTVQAVCGTLGGVDPKLQSALDHALAALRSELGDNLFSCCLYGSAVRGDAIEGISDINLLIVLHQSTSAAHEAIARAIGGEQRVDPFVLARRGFERSVRAFGPKFESIKRNYRVLYGADPLAALTFDGPMEKFLCEQAVRNLRLRLVFSFITRQRHNAYDRFVARNITPVFLQLSETLRLNGVSIPAPFEARIPILEKEFKIDGQVLRDLLALKKAPARFSETEAVAWHERLFPLLDTVLVWIETHWQN